MPFIEAQKLGSLPHKSAMPVPLSHTYNTFLIYYSLLLFHDYNTLMPILWSQYYNMFLIWVPNLNYFWFWLCSLFSYYIRLRLHVMIPLEWLLFVLISSLSEILFWTPLNFLSASTLPNTFVFLLFITESSSALLLCSGSCLGSSAS